MPPSSSDAVVTEDGFAAIQVVLREREARDRQWWDDMRDCIAEESTVALTWYQGSGYGFVDGAEALSMRRNPSRHRISPPVVRLAGDRAVISLAISIETYPTIEGVECVLSSYARHLYRLQLLAGAWRSSSSTRSMSARSSPPARQGRRSASTPRGSRVYAPRTDCSPGTWGESATRFPRTFRPMIDDGILRYGVAADMNTPDPEPGEKYPHINTQLFGIQDEAGIGAGGRDRGRGRGRWRQGESVQRAS